MILTKIGQLFIGIDSSGFNYFRVYSALLCSLQIRLQHLQTHFGPGLVRPSIPNAPAGEVAQLLLNLRIISR